MVIGMIFKNHYIVITENRNLWKKDGIFLKLGARVFWNMLKNLNRYMYYIFNL